MNKLFNLYSKIFIFILLILKHIIIWFYELKIYLIAIGLCLFLIYDNFIRSILVNYELISEVKDNIEYEYTILFIIILIYSSIYLYLDDKYFQINKKRLLLIYSTINVEYYNKVKNNKNFKENYGTPYTNEWHEKLKYNNLIETKIGIIDYVDLDNYNEFNIFEPNLYLFIYYYANVKAENYPICGDLKYYKIGMKLKIELVKPSSIFKENINNIENWNIPSIVLNYYLLSSPLYKFFKLFDIFVKPFKNNKVKE